MTVLLDANLLIGLLVEDHLHHDAAEIWFAAMDDSFATCPITEGSLVRLLVREGDTVTAATDLLTGVNQHPRHVFWPDDVPYSEVNLRGVVGHRQVTDAYLADLTRAKGGRLATFDKGLAALHDDVVELVEVESR